jgi:hypothetical protein
MIVPVTGGAVHGSFPNEETYVLSNYTESDVFGRIDSYCREHRSDMLVQAALVIVADMLERQRQSHTERTKQAIGRSHRACSALFSERHLSSCLRIPPRPIPHERRVIFGSDAAVGPEADKASRKPRPWFGSLLKPTD